MGRPPYPMKVGTSLMLADNHSNHGYRYVGYISTADTPRETAGVFRNSFPFSLYVLHLAGLCINGFYRGDGYCDSGMLGVYSSSTGCNK